VPIFGEIGVKGFSTTNHAQLMAFLPIRQIALKTTRTEKLGYF
jgi:hypothetical protein